MEALLRLSGLLGEDDSGKTDLGTLEKRLADKQAAGSSGVVSTMGSPVSPATQHQLGDGSGPVHHSPPITGVTSPNTAAPTPDTSNGNQLNPKQVEALADQMCSLVTNNCGETRYIGSAQPCQFNRLFVPFVLTTHLQALPLASPSFRPRAYNGSTTRRATRRSTT